MKVLSQIWLFLMISGSTFAITTKTVEYKEGKTVLEGYLAAPDANAGDKNSKKPAILVVHEWMGLNDYAKRRANELAEQGYITLAVDIYGKGVHAKDYKEAAELAGKYKSDRPLLRKRILAGYDFLKKQAGVDKDKLAAIGFCFGGTTALELARAGAKLQGVVSFHGGLSSPTPKDAKNIEAKILVLHGGIDPNVPAVEIADFMKEMNDAKVDYQFISYANTVHSFTNPEAGNDISKGAAYNPISERRSLEAMKTFFQEIF